MLLFHLHWPWMINSAMYLLGNSKRNISLFNSYMLTPKTFFQFVEDQLLISARVGFSFLPAVQYPIRHLLRRSSS
uniref:Putative ovule protein n=1 Tax=Solanum chacoense TaxID=4108 RepID=A0A0V0GSW0_SOLCH